MYRSIILIALLLGLVGCGSTEKLTVVSDLTNASLGEEAQVEDGLLVCTFGFGKQHLDHFPFSTMQLEYDGPEEGAVKLFGTRFLDVVDDNRAVDMFAVRLPPGKYAITGFGIHHVFFGGSGNWANRFPFRIPFEISSGEVTYIGECLMHLVSNEINWAITVLEGPYFVVSDQSERDIELFRQKYPNYNLDQFIMNVPERDENMGNVFFFFNDSGNLPENAAPVDDSEMIERVRVNVPVVVPG